jgi:signal peptidase I
VTSSFCGNLAAAAAASAEFLGGSLVPNVAALAVARPSSPRNHRELVLKRLIAMPGDWIQVPEKQEIRQIPQGHCWVEGDNASVSLDSRTYGPVSYYSTVPCLLT